MFTRYDLLPIRIDQAIRQAAILGAFPPVGASSAQGGAQVTLAAIAYAQRQLCIRDRSCSEALESRLKESLSREIHS